MVHRKKSFSNLPSHYLFTEIAQKKDKFLKANPDASLINLGIGDTTEPIPEVITDGIVEAAKSLSTREGYKGYGAAAGMSELREKIATAYYHDQIDSDEVFISDGSKCDIGRLQELFGSEVSIAVQDPTYPVYVDGSLLKGVQNIIKMPCLPENHFFPDLKNTPRTDLIYFCSPNNPTGSVVTWEQLSELVAFAEGNQSVIIFDSAYGSYIQDSSLPRSIFQVPGAKRAAIETGSFSKTAGFTGLRLGWTIVPKELRYNNGDSIRDDWIRVISTIFNAASNIVQRGGLKVLTPEGQSSVHHLVKHYLENAQILKEALDGKVKVKVYNGDQAPYLWVRIQGETSWGAFQKILEEAQILTIPGIGFGPSGEGFIRLSAFGSREQIEEAAQRLNRLY